MRHFNCLHCQLLQMHISYSSKLMKIAIPNSVHANKEICYFLFRSRLKMKIAISLLS